MNFKQSLHPVLSFFFPFLYTYSSTYHRNIRVGYRYGKKTLFTGDISQSGAEYIPMWQAALDALDIKTKQPSCLVLGVGGGTFISLFQSLYPKSMVTGIELDPIMLDAASQYFSLTSSAQVQLIQANAFEWIRKTKETFNVILVDLYINDLNPQEAKEKDFLQKLKSLMKKNGAIIYNADYQQKKPEEYQKFKTLCKKEFDSVQEVFAFPKNKVLVMHIHH